MEQAMRALLRLPLEIATAFFFTASIGIGAGVAAVSFTHRLGDGVKAAILAFVLAAATYGYLIWRTYRPQSATPVRRLRTIQAASPR
jgi:membrane protein implicated in regulation of membrane protease activity